MDPDAITTRLNDVYSKWARPATVRDIPALVELMREFYAEAGFQLPEENARRTFAELLGDPRLGRVWLIEVDGEPAGHVVLTF